LFGGFPELVDGELRPESVAARDGLGVESPDVERYAA
jgi:hypothetical protein